MKKVIVIALTIVMVFALSVPAFASSGEYTLSGKWELYEDYTYKPTTQIFQKVNYTCCGESWTSIRVQTNGQIGISRSDGMKTIVAGGKVNEDSRVLDFGSEPQVVSAEFYQFITEFAQPVGASTPDESLIAPPDWDVDTYPFGFIMLFPQSNEIYFYAYSVRGYANAEDRFGLNGPAVGVKYQYDLSAKTWTYMTDLELDEGYVSWDPSLTALYWANYNVYYEDGRTPFFMATPVMIDFVTTATLGGVMKAVMVMIPLCLVSLVGFVALRKALKVLRQTSQKA